MACMLASVSGADISGRPRVVPVPRLPVAQSHPEGPVASDRRIAALQRRFPLIKATTIDWTLGLLTATVTVLLMITKIHPMLVLGGGAALGAVGLVG